MFKTILLLSFLSFQFRVSAKENLVFADSSKYIEISPESFDGFQPNLFRTDTFTTQKHSAGNIIGQALAGIFCGAGFSVIPFSDVSSKLGSKDKPNSTSLIITIACYTFGSALGVHWLAKSENPSHSFGGTALSSLVGMGIGVGLAFSGIEDPPYVSTVLAILSPIIGSITYSTSIAEWSDENQNITLQPNGLLHKDIINNSKIFELELLRLEF